MATKPPYVRMPYPEMDPEVGQLDDLSYMDTGEFDDLSVFSKEVGFGYDGSSVRSAPKKKPKSMAPIEVRHSQHYAQTGLIN